MLRPKRSRIIWLALIALTVLLGLGSRRFGDHLPGLVAAHAGDTLWATTAILGFGLVMPRASTWAVALLAMATSVLVEASQLYKAPWIDAIRRRPSTAWPSASTSCGATWPATPWASCSVS